MKKSFFTFGLLMISLLIFSQSNSGLGFNYQAVVRGVDGFIMPSKSIELRFSLLPGQQATEASWVETHNVTTDAIGTIGVTVGKGTKTGGVAATFKDVNFAAVHYWLKVEIKEGGSYRELSYTALASVPYAEVATNAAVMPAGTVVSFMGPIENIPQGWLPCDGRAVSRSEYANLYAAIGTTWGFGDNATTFNLPDMRGLFERVVSGDSGRDTDAEKRLPGKEGGNSGNNVGTYQGDAIRNITGKFNGGMGFDGSHNYTGPFYGIRVNGQGGDSGAGGDDEVGFDISLVVPTADENRPINVYVYKIMKY